MLPKLHKNKVINDIIQKEQCEYITVQENIIVEARPIVASPITTPAAYKKFFISLWNHH